MVSNADFSRADGVMNRLLMIDRRSRIAAPSDEIAQTRRAENALTISLLFPVSAAFCNMSCCLSCADHRRRGGCHRSDSALDQSDCDDVDLSELAALWTIGYKHRWSYLLVALAALTLLVAFTVYDIVKLQLA